MERHELDALLASVDASGDALLGVQSTDVAPLYLDLEGLPSSPSLLDEALWWTVDEDTLAPTASPPTPDASVSSGGTSVSLDEPLQPEAAPVKTKPGSEGAYARVVASRRRAKGELEHLRRRVQDLELQLAQARALAAPASPLEADQEQDKIAGAVDQFWQRLAQAEREARQRAIAENLQLRAQLEAQLRTARSLEKLLRKRPHDDTGSHSAPYDAAFKRLRLGAGEDDASAVYASLLADLDVRYLQTEAVLEESGLAHRREAFQDAHVRFAANSMPSTSCVEFVTSNVVPFSYEMTRDVAWRALQSKSIPLSNGVYEAVETSEDDNTVKALFTIQTKLRGSDVVSRARFVARRYLEEHRVVVVWALASTIQGGILKNHRVELLEEGWSAISPLRTQDRDSENKAPLSLTQACGRLRPRMVIRAGSKLDELVGLLTDVFLDCYHDTQQGLYDFTGRMLLEEASRLR